MGQGPDQIEDHIDATLGRLGENLEELEDRVRSATDWRTQFEKRPGVLVALAFTGGVILSALTGALIGRPDDR